MYVTIERIREQAPTDYKISQVSDSEFTVTDVASGSSSNHMVSDYSFEYNALIDMNLDGRGRKLQFTRVNNDGIKFTFNYKGNNVVMSIYDENQYKYKKYLPEPTVLDHAKNVISPMPGAIVSVSVKPGDKVVEGQELLVIEAMKMQNIIKSEVEGEVKAVHVKAGASVAVDEILIEFK